MLSITIYFIFFFHNLSISIKNLFLIESIDGFLRGILLEVHFLFFSPPTCAGIAKELGTLIIFGHYCECSAAIRFNAFYFPPPHHLITSSPHHLITSSPQGGHHPREGRDPVKKINKIIKLDCHAMLAMTSLVV